VSQDDVSYTIYFGGIVKSVLRNLVKFLMQRYLHVYRVYAGLHVDIIQQFFVKQVLRFILFCSCSYCVFWQN
jgi:hypothetical protein